MNFFYKDKIIKEVINTKFLGWETDKHMNWKAHIMHILPKLICCYTIRCMLHYSETETQ
jgi:hypothetical protein